MKIKVKKLISGILAFSTFLGVGETKIALADDTHSIDKTKEPAPPAHTENKDKEKVNPYAITVLKELKEFKNAYDKEKGIDKKKDLVKSELDKVSAQLQKNSKQRRRSGTFIKEKRPENNKTTYTKNSNTRHWIFYNCFLTLVCRYNNCAQHFTCSFVV